MLQLLRDLVAHNGHANAALLNAIRQNADAVADTEVWDLLHHILLANRFWLLTILGLPFAFEEESRPSASFDALIQRYARTHDEQSAWLEAAAEPDLARMLENPLIPGGSCSVGQAFMQVCMHSHGHRAQCAKLLRRCGGIPPLTDSSCGSPVDRHRRGRSSACRARPHRYAPLLTVRGRDSR
jgi:uncharacterized damage-inducible protein DinB